MSRHATAAALQYVEPYSLLVVPGVEHANEAECARGTRLWLPVYGWKYETSLT